MNSNTTILLTKKAELLKVIAHPMRLCILTCLMEKECNVTKLIEKMGLQQSTVSQHLSKLRLAGIIVGSRSGTEIQYKIVNKEIEEIILLLLDDLHMEIATEYTS